jgi:hypothetical protein
LEADDSSSEGVALIATPYFEMLDQWQEEVNRAATRLGVTATRAEPEPSEAGDYQVTPTREVGNESDSGDEGGRRTRKRCKLDMSCLEQADKLQASTITLSANLKRTNAVLLSWSQDPKEARRRLMYHELSPEFHESGWMEIVTGKCVNLDNVYSIISSSRTIDKHTETIGGIELRYGTSEAVSKRVTTQAAWLVAWNRASRAILFAFPHRKAELDAYQEYICSQFGTNEEYCHSQVIRFDKAVRNRVASTRRYELSDIAAFQDIFHSHICSFKQDGKFCGRRHAKAKHVDERKP